MNRYFSRLAQRSALTAGPMTARPDHFKREKSAADEAGLAVAEQAVETISEPSPTPVVPKNSTPASQQRVTTNNTVKQNKENFTSNAIPALRDLIPETKEKAATQHDSLPKESLMVAAGTQTAQPSLVNDSPMQSETVDRPARPVDTASHLSASYNPISETSSRHSVDTKIQQEVASTSEQKSMPLYSNSKPDQVSSVNEVNESDKTQPLKQETRMTTVPLTNSINNRVRTTLEDAPNQLPRAQPNRVNVRIGTIALEVHQEAPKHPPQAAVAKPTTDVKPALAINLSRYYIREW